MLSSKPMRRKKSQTDFYFDPEMAGAISYLQCDKRSPGGSLHLKITLGVIALFAIALIAILPSKVENRNNELERQFLFKVRAIQVERKAINDKYNAIIASITDEVLLGDESHQGKKNMLRDQLKLVKTEMIRRKETLADFCPDCNMVLETFFETMVTCGERADYIVKKYKNEKDDVIEALIDEYPACLREAN